MGCFHLHPVYLAVLSLVLLIPDHFEAVVGRLDLSAIVLDMPFRSNRALGTARSGRLLLAVGRGAGLCALEGIVSILDALLELEREIYGSQFPEKLSHH